MKLYILPVCGFFITHQFKLPTSVSYPCCPTVLVLSLMDSLEPHVGFLQLPGGRGGSFHLSMCIRGEIITDLMYMAEKLIILIFYSALKTWN